MPKDKKEYEQQLEWAAQGKTSFVKAKEAFAIERILLDFVEHSGKPECKMKNSIPIYIPLLKAGSDSQKEYGGTGETGQTALGLAKLIVSNQLARRAEASRQKAKAANSKYPEDIWGCIGGTTASRSKDGKAVYRRVSIAPSTTEGSYVFKAETCEGEESSSGGVMPKKGAERVRITVRVDGLYMDALGEFILSEWTAFRTAQMLGGEPIEAKSVPATQEAPPVVEKKVDGPIFMIYDKNYYGLLGSAIGAEEAVDKLKEAFAKLKQEHGLVGNADEARVLKEQVLNPPHSGWLQTVTLKKKGTDEEDTLFVMVDQR